VARLEEALSSRSRATLAVSGGSTPKLLFRSLASAGLSWDSVHLFWVDERAVPPTDPRSNYRLAEEELIFPAHVPRRNAHRIQAELTPESAARRYVEEIRAFFGLAEGEVPHFDAVHCGLGPDAHTASLFPGEPLIEDRERIAAAVCVASLREWRVTLLPAALLAAREVVFLVAGEDKAGALRAVFSEPLNPAQYPAHIFRLRDTAWFVDAGAARLLDES